MEEYVAAKCVSHPLRRQILDVLKKGSAKSPNELSKQLGEKLTNTAYHVRILDELGAIEMVEFAQRRGAIEHYYRLRVKISPIRVQDIEYTDQE